MQISVQPVPGWPDLDAVMEAAEQEATAYLQGRQATMVDSLVSTSLRVTTGPAAEGIIDMSDSQQVDLIVMRSYGRSGLTRWRYGSVTARLLRQAPCPVLVIPDQTGDEPFAFRCLALDVWQRYRKSFVRHRSSRDGCAAQIYGLPKRALDIAPN